MPACVTSNPLSSATGATSGTFVPPAAGSPGSDCVVPGPCASIAMPGSPGLTFLAFGSFFALPMVTDEPASVPSSNQRLPGPAVVFVPVPVVALVPLVVVVLVPLVTVVP